MIVPNATVIRFLEGRLTFVGAASCAPFASAVVVFDQPLRGDDTGPSMADEIVGDMLEADVDWEP